MDLSIESIIAIFAVLKAGKIYSAPDLKHPPERLAQMLENGQPALLLTTTPHLALAQSLAGEKRFVFDTTQSLAHYSSENPPLHSDADSIYYITYTSSPNCAA